MDELITEEETLESSTGLGASVSQEDAKLTEQTESASADLKAGGLQKNAQSKDDYPFLSIEGKSDLGQKSLAVYNMRLSNLLDSIVDGRHPCCSSGKKDLIRSVATREAFEGLKQMEMQEAFSFNDSPVKDNPDWSHVVGTKFQFEKFGIALDETNEKIRTNFVGKDGNKKSVIWSVASSSIGYAKGDENKEKLLVSSIFRYYAAEQTTDPKLVVTKMHDNANQWRDEVAKTHDRKDNSFDFSKFAGDKVEAKESDVTKYLSAYLTACKKGCEFVASADVIKAFRDNVQKMTQGREFNGKVAKHSNTNEFAKCCAVAEKQSRANVKAQIVEKNRENARLKHQQQNQEQSIGR